MPGYINSLDAAIQRHVDETAFFFMRRFNVGKGHIRLGLHGILADTWLLPALVLPDRIYTPSSRLLNYMMVGMLLIISVRSFQIDEATDKAKLPISPSDAWMMARGGFFKTLMTAVLIMMISGLASQDKQAQEHAFMQLVAWLPLMINIYFCATPRMPPPEEQRETTKEPVPFPFPVGR